MKNKQIPVRKKLPSRVCGSDTTVSIEGYSFKGRESHSLTELVKRFLKDEDSYKIDIRITRISDTEGGGA